MKKTYYVEVCFDVFDFDENKTVEIPPDHLSKVVASSPNKAKKLAEALECKELMRFGAYIVSVHSEIMFSSEKNSRRWNRICDRGMRSRSYDLEHYQIELDKVTL